MSDAVWVALIAGVPLAITSLGNLIVAIRNGRKQDEHGKKLDEGMAKVEEVKRATNGMKMELEAVARAQGFVEGKASQAAAAAAEAAAVERGVAQGVEEERARNPLADRP